MFCTSFSEIGVGLVEVPPTKPVTLAVLFHQVPGVVGHFHLDEHVAREEFALGNILLPALHLDDFFHRHQDLAELFLHAGACDTVDQRALHALLEAGVRVHYIPFLAHESP
jgi:hypothetical protein